MFASPIGATDIDKDCVPGERTRAFYELRAKGGAAAVTMSELVVHPETDGSHMLHLDLATVGSLAASPSQQMQSRDTVQCQAWNFPIPASMQVLTWQIRTKSRA